MTTAVIVSPVGLTECEAVIERGLTAFTEVGLALTTIRDGKLYRASYPTFEAYCEHRWGFTRVRAHQLITGAETTRALTRVNSPAPTSERQARELTGLPTETAAKVMTEAAAAGNVTAASIREARERVTPHPKPRRRPLADGFRDATLDLGKLITRIRNLAADDRLPRSRAEVAHYANDLIRARDGLQHVIDQMSQPHSITTFKTQMATVAEALRQSRPTDSPPQ
jgi:hypothetical protein